MRGSRTKTRCALVVLLVTAAVLAVTPLQAAAAEREAVTFSLGFFGGPATPTHANAQVVKFETVSYLGAISSSSPLLSGDTGALLDWTLLPGQGRAIVSGEWDVIGHPDNRSWFGELHGHFTAEGGSGVITGTANTGERFHGTWTSLGFVDPAGFHQLIVLVSGVVLS